MTRSIIQARHFNISAIKTYFSREGLKSRLKRWTEDFEKSSFADIKEFSRSKGKLFSSSQRVVPLKSAKDVPEIHAVSANGEKVNINELLKGKVTLLTISHNTLAYAQISTYKEPFLSHFEKNPSFQCIEMNVIERWLYKAFSFFIRLDNRKLPLERKRHYFNFYGNFDFVCPALMIRNKTFGHVVLVDGNNKVRWIAQGEATSQEIRSMLEIAQKLDESQQDSQVK